MQLYWSISDAPDVNTKFNFFLTVWRVLWHIAVAPLKDCFVCCFMPVFGSAATRCELTVLAVPFCTSTTSWDGIQKKKNKQKQSQVSHILFTELERRRQCLRCPSEPPPSTIQDGTRTRSASVQSTASVVRVSRTHTQPHDANFCVTRLIFVEA